MSHFSERLYGRDLGQIGILGRNWHFRWGWFENFWYKKSWIRISSQKDGSNCNFYNFSLLVPYHNKFLVVGICILIFYGTHYPLPTIFFFFVGAYFFVCLVPRGWEDFKFHGDLLYWGDLISFLGEAARTFFSMEQSMTNHVNSRIVDGKIICFMCAC